MHIPTPASISTAGRVLKGVITVHIKELKEEGTGSSYNS
jgi:hypothetical protein